MADIYISGSENEINSPDLRIGSEAFHWMGDDLPFRTGEIPSGYVTKPGYKIYYRTKHSPGHFTYGPYFENNGIGEMRAWIFMDATNRVDGDAFTVDIVNAHDLNNPIISPRTFRTDQLPVNSQGFIVYSDAFKISPNQSIEVRVRAEGATDLRIFLLRLERSIL